MFSNLNLSFSILRFHHRKSFTLMLVQDVKTIRSKNHHFYDSGICILNIYILKVSENPEDLEKPDGNDNYNHNIEDFLDFTIHRDVIIDKIQKNSCNDQHD